MKIGIITFWESSDNYGQVLQAYALQRVLKDMGHDPYQIRYSLKASSCSVNKQSIIKKIIKALLVYPVINKIRQKWINRYEDECKLLIEQKNEVRQFRRFRNDNIKQSEIVYNSIDEIRSNPPQADCYLTGSDQVWTMLLGNEGNKAYFLDFGDRNIKRVSYAASFGRSQYPKELIPELKLQLQHFDSISVREKEGIDICKCVGMEAMHVLDPTLLLKKQDYLALGESIQKPGIFIYSINIKESKELYWNQVKNYGHSKGLSITVTTSSGNFSGREIFGDVDYLYATIPEWINCIKNANIVVTTSFHGVVFCLLMHTNFVYVPLAKEGSRGNGRVESLLSSLEIKDKICYKENDFYKTANNAIDWVLVDENLEKLRKHSIAFLYNSLN